MKDNVGWERIDDTQEVILFRATEPAAAHPPQVRKTQAPIGVIGCGLTRYGRLTLKNIFVSPTGKLLAVENDLVVSSAVTLSSSSSPFK